MRTYFAHVEEALTHLHGEAPQEGMAAVQFNMGASEAALDRYENADALLQTVRQVVKASTKRALSAV